MQRVEAKLSTDKFYSGTSGLVLPVPNKTHYPAQFRDLPRLSYYASLFSSIEVNSSFYKIPQAKTMAKWAGEVPESFQFTFKLWRGITHEKNLAFNPADVARFMQVIDHAGPKKGCLLVQFPPSAKAGLLPQVQQLVSLIHEADADNSWKIVLEFRHKSWYTDRLMQYADTDRLTIAIQDIPASVTPLDYAMGDAVYLRFHGPGGRYSGSYPDEILQEYAIYIHEWLQDGKTVYAYFNNTMGDAVKNLATLNGFVRQA